MAGGFKGDPYPLNVCRNIIQIDQKHYDLPVDFINTLALVKRIILNSSFSSPLIIETLSTLSLACVLKRTNSHIKSRIMLPLRRKEQRY